MGFEHLLEMGLSKHGKSGERPKPPDKFLLDLETKSQLPDSASQVSRLHNIAIA